MCAKIDYNPKQLISRRNFLKIAGLAALATTIPIIPQTKANPAIEELLKRADGYQGFSFDKIESFSKETLYEVNEGINDIVKAPIPSEMLEFKFSLYSKNSEQLAIQYVRSKKKEDLEAIFMTLAFIAFENKNVELLSLFAKEDMFYFTTEIDRNILRQLVKDKYSDEIKRLKMTYIHLNRDKFNTLFDKLYRETHSRREAQTKLILGTKSTDARELLR